MVVTSGEPGAEDERCLLGRQAVWPEGRYSTLAGFCEPGETLEDAVRREVAEEVGVRVGEVDLLRQPALAAAGQPDAGLRRAARRRPRSASTTHEIEDARWFTRAEMKSRGRGGHAGAARAGSRSRRSLVEHWYGGAAPRQLVSPRPAAAGQTSAASFSLTWASDGLVCAVPSE